MNLLSARGLCHRLGDKQLFDNASLDIRKGAVTGLLGPNGAGKTTFFDILCGLQRPQSGTVTNNAATQLYLSQTLSTPASLRMHEVFKLLAALACSSPLSNDQVTAQLQRWPARIGERYKEISRKKPSTCSYGEIRCFFTLSLLLIPSELVILDEPTAGVDPEFRYYIWQCLRQAADNGTTVLVSSHYIDELANHCDVFHAISNRRFTTFNCAEEYLTRYNAASLDQAFINSLA